jgi:hypothetical protein
MDVSSRTICAAALLAGLAACNSSSSGTDAGSTGGGGPPPVVYSLQGVWKGSYAGTVDFDGTSRIVSSTELFGLIQKGGPALFFDTTGQVYMLPGADSDPALSESGSVYPPAYDEFSLDDLGPAELAAVGSASRSVIDAQFGYVTFIGGEGDGPEEDSDYDLRVHLQPFKPMAGAASLRSGHWSGFYPDYPGGRLNSIELDATPDGKFTGTDIEGCQISGSLTPVPSEDDLFSVAMDFSRGNCAAHMKGLAFESHIDYFDLFGHAGGDYYYLVVYQNSTSPLPPPEGDAVLVELQVQ